MSPVIAWLAVIFWLGVIWFFGRAGFGRANTQRLIDLLKHYRRLWGFLDKHHGKFRAAFHYIEFGACYAALYAAVSGGFAWHYGKGAAVWGATLPKIAPARMPSGATSISARFAVMAFTTPSATSSGVLVPT